MLLNAKNCPSQGRQFQRKDDCSVAERLDGRTKLDQAADFCAVADGVKSIANAFGIADWQTFDAKLVAVVGEIVDGLCADSEDNGVAGDSGREVEIKNVDTVVGDVEHRCVWIETNAVSDKFLLVIFSKIRIGSLGDFAHVYDSDLLTGFGQLAGNFHTDKATTDDGYFFTNFCLIHQHIVALNDVDMFKAFAEWQALWHSAACQHNNVWTLSLEIGAVNDGVITDGDARLFENALLGWNEGAVFGFFITMAGNAPLTAKAVVLFSEGDMMATFGQGGSGFHACQPAADNEHVFYFFGRFEGVELVFAQVAWVDGAAALCWYNFTAGAFTIAVEAADALNDFVVFAVCSFDHPFWIYPQRTAEGDEVSLTSGDGFVGQAWRTELTVGDNCDIRHSFFTASLYGRV